MADEKALPSKDRTLTILAKISIREQYEVNPQSTLEDNFWDYFRRIKFTRFPDASLSDISNKEFEARIERNFGDRLKTHFIRYFNAPWGIDTDEDNFVQIRVPDNQLFYEDRKKLAAVFFQAKIKGYGSLNLGIDVTGVDQLIGLFNNNFDLFSMFLSAYVPLALAESIEWGVRADNLDVTFVNAGSLHSLFIASGSNNLVVSGHPNAQEGNRKIVKDLLIWGISNFSLLIPVALATAFIWLAYAELGKYRETLSAKETKLNERFEEQQNKLIQQLINSQVREERLLDKLQVLISSEKQEDKNQNVNR